MTENAAPEQSAPAVTGPQPVYTPPEQPPEQQQAQVAYGHPLTYPDEQPDPTISSATSGSTDTTAGDAPASDGPEPFHADEPESIPPPAPGNASGASNATPTARPNALIRLADALGHVGQFFARHPELREHEADLTSAVNTSERMGP